jgi:hypothetical protein
MGSSAWWIDAAERRGLYRQANRKGKAGKSGGLSADVRRLLQVQGRRFT